ncbi:MAG TPA: hypothetical protein PLW65_16040 [Pseudomonadota bacterium]|nr:hypothetical protein [Pseudomonadota bacterium]
MRWAVFDELVGRATQDETDVRLAREEWSAQTGRVHPDHELYGERSDAFVEWYVLDRRGVDGLTAVERALLPTAPPPIVNGAAAGPGIDNGPDGGPNGVIDKGLDRATCLALRAAHRSLFFVRELQPGGARVDDVLGGAQFEVDERRSLRGVQPGDLFETRVVPDPERPYRLVFSRAMLFHPRGVSTAVFEHARAARARREPRAVVLARLQRLRLRCFAYKHVAPLRIYSQKDAPP